MGTNFPLITNRWLPSIDPSVPSSAIINWKTCSGLLCIILQISWKLTHKVFFVPTIDSNKKYCVKLCLTYKFSENINTFHELGRFHRILPFFSVLRIVLVQKIHSSLQKFLVWISGWVYFDKGSRNNSIWRYCLWIASFRGGSSIYTFCVTRIIIRLKIRIQIGITFWGTCRNEREI